MRLRSISFIVFLSISITVFFLIPKPTLLHHYSFSKAVYDNHQHLLRLTLSRDEKYRLFTPLSKLPKELIEATLLQEDQYFYWHFGLNPFAVFKAFWHTYILKTRTIGASTISMQLARIRFGIHSKKAWGKVEQIYRALQLELHYSKEELLEAYLNLAPYGGNIEGVGAASLVYFNHQVKDIKLPQALILSVIPQNPTKRTPDNKDLKRIRNHLFERWLAKHPEDMNKKELFHLPLVMQSIRQLPFLAPHFTHMVLSNDGAGSIKTSLDLKLQNIIERVTHRYLARKKTYGVNNAVVLLIDTRDMSIKAMMGSADFFNKKISGQINGVETKRSPGSTLKPFIYGLALDQGLIHPNTVLKDVPYSFNGYNPENFDYDFVGPIKARDALALSRNIPAIYLSSQLTHPTLHELLESAQITQLKPESYYGLSLNLGSVELTMKELVGLYAMLANDGLWYPIQVQDNALARGLSQGLSSQSMRAGKRLLSPEASFLVLDMLQNAPASDLNTKAFTKTPVSWKTGTSSGYRDAWTVGAFGPYVLGVWIGNFDNTANPSFIGKEIAAPLFFELIEAIKQEAGPIVALEKNPNTMNLKKIEVCKASGMLPTRYCTNREWSWFIPGVSPIKTDTIFKEVAINNKTGLRTCHIDESTRFEVFEFWPSDLLKIFKKAGIQRHTPPFFEAGCVLGAYSGGHLQISSPRSGVKYVLRADSTTNNQIPLSAITDAGTAHLYWFINEAFIAKTKANQPFIWNAKPGRFIVRVVDDQGVSDARDLEVLITNE